MADNQQQQKPVNMRATVARGRTLVMPDPNAVSAVVGYDVDGKPIKRVKTMEVNEHNEVELPIDEVRRLRKLGYLIDPDAKELPMGEGPNFTAGTSKSGGQNAGMA